MNDNNYMNDFIEKVLNECDMSFYYLLDKYCLYIYKNTEEYYVHDYTKMNALESEKIIESFLDNFSQDLLDNYLNIRDFNPGHFQDISTLKFEVENRIEQLNREKLELEDLLVHPEKTREEKHYFIEDHIELLECLINVEKEKLRAGNYIDLMGNVHCTLENNASDIFSILHEYTHKFFWQQTESNEQLTEVNDILIDKQILGETPTITMELILCDYLIQIGYTEDAKNFMLWRFNEVRNNTLNFHYIMLMLQNYSKFHTINDTIMNAAILNEDEIIQAGFLSKKFDLNQMYNATSVVPYIVGILIGCQLKTKIKENPYILIELGKSIYDDNLRDSFLKLGIEQFNGPKNNTPTLNLEICNNFIDEYNNLRDIKESNIK